MPVFRTVNMPMGFVVLLPFSTSFSTPENAVMHPVQVLTPSPSSSRHHHCHLSSLFYHLVLWSRHITPFMTSLWLHDSGPLSWTFYFPDVPLLFWFHLHRHISFYCFSDRSLSSNPLYFLIKIDCSHTSFVGFHLFLSLPWCSYWGITVTVTPLSTVYRPVGSHCNSSAFESQDILSPSQPWVLLWTSEIISAENSIPLRSPSLIPSVEWNLAILLLCWTTGLKQESPIARSLLSFVL